MAPRRLNGRLAEIAGEYLRKGSQVYVEGSIRSRKYTDKDGIERNITEIRADEMKMLGKREGMGGPSGGDDGDDGGYRRAAPAPASRQQPAAKPASKSTGFDDMDDDIPF